MLRRFVLSLLLFLAPVSLLAEAKIPVKDRVRNEMPGYCVWCSLETVCRHQRVKAGYGLKEGRKLDHDWVTWDGRVIPRNFGDDDSIEWKLKSLGIPFKMNHIWNKNKEGLKLIVKATEAGHGAVVGVWSAPTCPGQHHAITITDINSKTFSYIDSNYPRVTYEGSLDWFLCEWDGLVVVIEK